MVPEAAVIVSLLEQKTGLVVVYEAYQPVDPLLALVLKRMSILFPVEVNEAGRVAPEKVPRIGDVVSDPLYTITLSKPLSVSNFLKFRVILVIESEGAISHLQSELF